MRANLPAVIRSAVLAFKTVPSDPGSEHAQLVNCLNRPAFAPQRTYDENKEWSRVINLQRYACLVYGSARSSPKMGQKVMIVA
jgi:hypothetical protein